MGYPPRRCVPAASLLAALVLLTAAAAAQTAGSEGLSPTLANIKRAHVVDVMGHKRTRALQTNYIR